MKKYRFSFIFFLLFLGINFSFAQIEVKKPAAPVISHIAYDSLLEFSEVTDVKVLKGQEICFLPLSPIYQKRGYMNVHTKVLESNEMELNEQEFAILPKNKKFVFEPNPTAPYYSDPQKLLMTKWKIEDIIVKKEEQELFESHSYLKLTNAEGKTMYYFINTMNMTAESPLLLTGYFEKLVQTYQKTAFISRRNVVLKDFYTNESFFSAKEEVWNTKKLIISMLEDDSKAKPYLLLTNAKQNHIIIPMELADETNKYISPTWRFLFLNLELKKKYHISDENWQKVIVGTPQIGMTKQEVMVSIGLPTTTFSDFAQTMKDSEWEYLVRGRAQLRIVFWGDKVQEVWNFEDECITPYPVKPSKE